MNALGWTLFAAGFAATFNYLMKRVSGDPRRVSAFLVIMMALSALLAALFGSGPLPFSWTLGIVALIAGVFFGGLFINFPKAFQNGPAGLTVGIVQSACIVPPLAMSIFFGERCGYIYGWLQGLGALLVVLGFTRAIFKQRGLTKRWALATLAAFTSLTIVFIALQYQALLYCRDELQMRWFLPLFFASTATVLAIRHFLNGWSLSTSLFFSTSGAICTFLANQFLVIALGLATGVLSLLIVPIYSVLIIAFCNLWSQWLYKERVDWLGTAIAASGIVISFM